MKDNKIVWVDMTFGNEGLDLSLDRPQIPETSDEDLVRILNLGEQPDVFN